MVTDRIGDFIIRLQNAAKVGKETITVPHSGYLLSIAKKLKELGFIATIDEKGDTKKDLVITLAYGENGAPRLRGVKRVSKPGRRLYVASADAHTVKGGTGIRIISSSNGIVTDAEARKAHVGGENLFEIW